MLQSIRDRTHGWIAGVIIGLLIISFALWGVHSYFGGNGNTNIIAKVNGVEITKNQLALTYDRMHRQMQIQLNSTAGFSEKIEADLKKQALESLITLQVLKLSSINQNYRISDNQIDEFLEHIPDFQVNGQFSVARFKQVLASTMLSVQDFLEMIKTSLLIDQPRLGMIFSSFALPNEVNHSYALIEQERDITYAMIDFDNVSKQSIAISHDKIEAYYKQHEDEFRTPEQVSIEYITLAAKDIAAKIQPTAEALKAFYNENSSSFGANTHYEQVKDKVKESYVHQQAEEKFAEVKEKLASLTYEHPETLTIAAKALGLVVNKSQEFTKDKGGKDISANAKVRDIAFSNDVLNQQNNSDVIQVTPDTMIVLRINTRTPAALLPLAQVEKQIENKLKTNEIQEKTFQLAQQIITKLHDGMTLTDAAQQYHLKLNKIGFIGRHSTKVDSAIINAAFAIPPSENGKQSFASTKAAKGYAIIVLNAIHDGVLSAADKQQYKLFAEQVQNSQGLLEYELYKQSQINRSKIIIESN